MFQRIEKHMLIILYYHSSSVCHDYIILQLSMNSRISDYLRMHFKREKKEQAFIVRIYKTCNRVVHDGRKFTAIATTSARNRSAQHSCGTKERKREEAERKLSFSPWHAWQRSWNLQHQCFTIMDFHGEKLRAWSKSLHNVCYVQLILYDLFFSFRNVSV